MFLYLRVLKKTFAIVCVLCLFPFFLGAYSDCNQCFNTPWTYSIISDYGPRNVVEGTWFHRGIDYAMPRNTGIVPIEEGEINNIDFDKKYGGGWYIIVKSKSQEIYWYFFHLFSRTSDTTPVYSCPTPPCNNTKTYDNNSKFNFFKLKGR